MELGLTSDQRMLVNTFARFLDAESGVDRVRAALPQGFDQKLWKGLAELGALEIRVPECAGGLGLGIFDAGLLMEEAGRTLASGPLAEAIVAARLLVQLDPEDRSGLRDAIANGNILLTIALHDITNQPEQFVAGGTAADAVIACDGDRVVLIRFEDGTVQVGSTPASALMARLRLGTTLATGQTAKASFCAAVEEWKLLTASALTGLARESLRLAAAYACERTQFDRVIGTFQAISHPLADISVQVDAGRLLVWSAIRAIADGKALAGEAISSALWWASMVAEKAVAQALHTFGGYGFTLEHDIHLFNLRAKTWPLVLGDPNLLLEEAAARRYNGEQAHLPDAGPLFVEFGLGDEAQALADEVRDFFEVYLTPELRAKAHHSFEGHDAGFHKKLAQAGLLFPAWPTHLGGRKASPYAVQAAYKVWDENYWTPHPAKTTTIIGFIMDRFGSDQLKTGALRRVVEGESICVLGFSEPSSGSDEFAAKTRATRDGDGWRIDGSKMFTSGADIADYVLLLARTDSSGLKHKGLTMFIVPLKAEGITIQAVHTFQDERTNVTYYDGVYVSDSYRLGEVGAGALVMVASLEIEHGISFVRHHSELLSATERFCRDMQREGKPMIEHPNVQQRLARTSINVAAATMLHYRTLWVTAEKKPNPAYGPSSKMFSSEVYKADSVDLLNLTAPESLAFSNPEASHINLCYRHSQVATVYGGTSEVHRSVIAEKQLGLPRTR